MFSKICPKVVQTVLFAALAVSSSAQVVPSATRAGGLTIDVGAGPSYYHMDWGHGDEFGGTLWVDANLDKGPLFLKGLGVELEARDLSLDRGSTLPNDMRTDTLGGGPIYSWRHFDRVRPYTKFLVSYGNLDINKGGYHFDWVLYQPGAGVEYRPFGHVWVRADYEYQIWPKLFGSNWSYDPDGVTVGVLYEFRHHRSEDLAKPQITGIWPATDNYSDKPRITGITPVQQ